MKTMKTGSTGDIVEGRSVAVPQTMRKRNGVDGSSENVVAIAPTTLDGPTPLLRTHFAPRPKARPRSNMLGHSPRLVHPLPDPPILEIPRSAKILHRTRTQQ